MSPLEKASSSSEAHAAQGEAVWKWHGVLRGKCLLPVKCDNLKFQLLSQSIFDGRQVRLCVGVLHNFSPSVSGHRMAYFMKITSHAPGKIPSLSQSESCNVRFAR